MLKTGLSQRRLIIRPGAIGDCILALPAMESLRARYTEVWVSPPVVPLIQFAERVRSIASMQLDLLEIDPPSRLLEELRTFDSIVSWYGSARDEFRSAAAQYPFTFHAALPPPNGNLHATDFFARQVGAADGLIPRFTVHTQPRGSVVIHPFSGSKRKNWPLEHFRQVAQQLPSVEWLAGPEEHLEEAHRFDDLGQLATWLGGARLYIGNDSGITHLAAAVGVPVLALFGPTDPGVWAPRGANVTVMRSEPIRDLLPSRVLQAAERLLAFPPVAISR